MILMLACSLAGRAQTMSYMPSDSICVEKLLGTGSSDPLFYARQFLGRPYVAHTLEVNDEELLVVNTRQMDCTTLVETVTALTLCAMQGKTTFADYADMLNTLRYRQGVRNGYTSRLHYFSDWIDDKQQMGIVSEIQEPNPPFTALQKVQVSFMSRHPEYYRSLKKHPDQVAEISKQEKQLSGREYRYIPKWEVKNTALMRATIKDGDILAITTSKDGLDIAHLGFAVWHKNGLHLLNASQLHKRVVEEPMTLYKYLSKHPKHTGIRVIRINKDKH